MHSMTRNDKLRLALLRQENATQRGLMKDPTAAL